ncbi:hypothetical protein [Mesorhizobium sp. M2A.F.Ca.ET.037.01.1.1]|uniref:hypothetical protein n=1 Tax=Mesorhizobium sp. M2A.F.Ca.ET.037.01.1.1 TaxID=2496748 RepID=UPI001676971C|nr:hypothetical protein [Mesorhizobium sp. M2A.F.Ca.ET.037.01.1.1]
MTETVLAMLEQHVLLGERHLARQREIVAYIHQKGFRADLAEELLELFEQMQLLHIAHRNRLLNSNRDTTRFRGGGHGADPGLS